MNAPTAQPAPDPIVLVDSARPAFRTGWCWAYRRRRPALERAAPGRSAPRAAGATPPKNRPPQQNLWGTFHASRPFGIGFVAGNKADSASGGFVATGFILSAGLTRVSLRIAVRGKEPHEGGPGGTGAPGAPGLDPTNNAKSHKTVRGVVARVRMPLYAPVRTCPLIWKCR